MYKRDDKIRKYHITYLNRIGNSLKCNSTKIVKLGRLGCRLCTDFLSWYRYNDEDDEVDYEKMYREGYVKRKLKLLYYFNKGENTNYGKTLSKHY